MHVPLVARARAVSSSRAMLAEAASALAAVTAWLTIAATPSAALPEIRMSRENRVPACVTPDRLMRFLTSRNPRVETRFRDIARYYRQHGEALRVRWDYAFFQMVIETNYLSYRRPDGRWGDVRPSQNNFAGIGTTGGGVPGDRFTDVSSGVLGQMQHLVAYSGEYVAEPVAPRTALKQDHIIALSRSLERPVRFSDLARRWAVDPRYGASIEYIATSFRSEYCARRDNQAREALPWRQSVNAPAPAGDAAAPRQLENPSFLGAEPQLRTQPVAARRPPQVARTIWRRKETEQPVRVANAPRPSLATPAPAPAPAPRPPALAANHGTAKDRDAMALLAGEAASGTPPTTSLEVSHLGPLIAGLSAIASSFEIVAPEPAPRLATRSAP